ncbi:MAG: PfkB family carbohydrate kinase [Lachnospiraceae bacterium]|nr:PfkB family carbohydrate kinase [Lachnospiraceae bacterium]
MAGNKYDLFIIGQPSLDVNTDHLEHTVHEIGGAVIYSSYAAANLGHKVCVYSKCNPETIDNSLIFKGAPNVDVIPAKSALSTSIANNYLSADKEKRTCEVISRIDPYTPSEIPEVDAAIYHIAGLMNGDIEESVIELSAKRAKVAVDVQGFLRCVESNKTMQFYDWPRKKELLPLITFLKTDAAEAEVMTGTSDRRKAAKILYSFGAKEIMITHNTEVLIYDGEDFYTEPLKPRNLSGRSGRGDTTFASYITERLTHNIPEALLTAAATVSLKMEKAQPFMGNREDVENYINEFFR